MNTLRFPGASNIHVLVGVSLRVDADILESVTLFTENEVVLRREGAPRCIDSSWRNIQADQLFCVRIRQRFQQHTFGDRKDSRGGADGQSQGHDACTSQSGVSPQPASSV